MGLRGRNAAAGRAVLIGGYADGGWHRNIHDPTVIRSSFAVAMSSSAERSKPAISSSVGGSRFSLPIRARFSSSDEVIVRADHE
jgi:hypothetical protein